MMSETGYVPAVTRAIEALSRLEECAADEHHMHTLTSTQAADILHLVETYRLALKQNADARRAGFEEARDAAAKVNEHRADLLAEEPGGWIASIIDLREAADKIRALEAGE